MYKYLLFLLLLSGCVTQKRCEEKYPPVKTVEYVTKTIIKDSIINIPAEHVTDTVKVSIDCSDGIGKIVPFISHSKQGRSSATVSGSGNTLLVYNSCDALKIEVQKLKEYKYTKEHEVHEPKIVKHIPQLFKWCFGIVLSQIIILFGYILYVLYRKFR